jgi:serine/threonine protein kinase
LPLALRLDVPNRNYEVYYKFYPLDLHGLLVRLEKPLPEPAVKTIFYSILSGLEHMHSNRFLHRDVKSSNVLIGPKEIVISDFGMACQFSVPALGLSSHIGTPNFRAPELISFSEEKGYLTGVDIWSVGCIIFETMTLKSLFKSSNDKDLKREILNLFGSDLCKEVLDCDTYYNGTWMYWKDQLIKNGYSE